MSAKAITYPTLISETVSELTELERSQHQARQRDYVRFLRYLKEGSSLTQRAAGERIGLKARQSQSIWSRYRKAGLPLLLRSNYQGSVGKLSYCQLIRLQAFLRDATTPLTQQQVADWIATNWEVHYDQSGISKLFRRMRIKLKTGRPSNTRKDEAGADAFKKTSPP
ncbi:MAG: winged helix-turn-helix domain-containing protein [Ferruginibacter sp.]|nr:winged helix-turn-helix domain-containing protein [Cytophagales bacterium]